MYAISKVEVPRDSLHVGIREGCVYEVEDTGSGPFEGAVIVKDSEGVGCMLYAGEYIIIKGRTEDTREGAPLIVESLVDYGMDDITAGNHYEVVAWNYVGDSVGPVVVGDRGVYILMYPDEYTIVGLKDTSDKSSGPTITGEQKCVSDYDLLLIPGNYLMMIEGDSKTYIRVRGYDNGILWYNDCMNDKFWGDIHSNGKTMKLTNQQFRRFTDDDLEWITFMDIIRESEAIIGVDEAKKIADKMMEYSLSYF